MYIPQLRATNSCFGMYYVEQAPINKFQDSITNTTVCLTLYWLFLLQFSLGCKLSQRCCRQLRKYSREAVYFAARVFQLNSPIPE